MQKLFILMLIVTGFTKASQAQTNELVAENEAGKLYIDHTVAPKENWYSIGRLYNISPKEIAPFNGTVITRPLDIGEHLKIPLTTNFSQNGLKAADETFVPVYHIIQEKEWLAHISSSHNNVPVTILEKWNHITKEQAKAGMHLIVGYLKVKPALSALANGGKNNVSVAITESKTENKIADATVAPKEENKPAQVVKQEQKTTTPPATNKPSTASTISYNPNHSAGGYFSAEFNEGSKSTTGMAGTFKSTSGWQDEKYYALMNNVPVGKIVKVIAPATQKSVFAKVLGELPQMKESEGLTIRLSNAAAKELGEGEFKFNVQVKW
jgi:hypothetical protein